MVSIMQHGFCFAEGRIVGSHRETNMNRKKILIVDDDAVILETLSTKLTAKGYEVLTAADGATAVSTVRRAKPDLILLDVNLPVDASMEMEWDAFRIMEWLKRLDEVAKIPVIVITGGDPNKNKERSFAAGATAFFHKPINHDELIKAIRKTLGEDPDPAPVAKG